MTSGGPDELVLRASRGEAQAVDELLVRHLPGLRRYVDARMGPGLRALESGGDVVQSVCRELLEDLPGFEFRGEEAFRAWLQRTALRKLIDHQRHHQAQKRGAAAGALSAADLALLASSIRSPSQDALIKEQVAALERAFARLTPTDREMLRMIRVEGLSHAEAARRLRCSVESSRKQLSRALARLARLLE